MNRKIEQNTSEFIIRDEYLLTIYSQILEWQINALGINPSSSVNKILEIGSSGGITKYLYPNITTLDIRDDSDIKLRNEILPFLNNTVDGILAKDTLHHIPNSQLHLSEVLRVLKPGARAVYVEPYWNSFSKFIYSFIHPEPWNSQQIDWRFTSRGPMDSNQALPWIIFVRDRNIFSELFPEFKVSIIRLRITGLSYLMSGGVHNRTCFPSKFLIFIHRIVSRLKNVGGIFDLSIGIVLEKKEP